MKRWFFVLMFLLAGIPFSVSAQVNDLRRNIGLDSLISIMQQHTPQKIYYMSDAASANLTFTVDASRGDVRKNIEGALMECGFTISCTEGFLFVLKGAGIKEDLPAGYYVIATDGIKVQEKSQDNNEEQEYLKLLQGGQNIASTANKINKQ